MGVLWCCKITNMWCKSCSSLSACHSEKGVMNLKLCCCVCVCCSGCMFEGWFIITADTAPFFSYSLVSNFVTSYLSPPFPSSFNDDGLSNINKRSAKWKKPNTKEKERLFLSKVRMKPYDRSTKVTEVDGVLKYVYIHFRQMLSFKSQMCLSRARQVLFIMCKIKHETHVHRIMLPEEVERLRTT